jgi:hypothetical protein
MGFFVPSDDIHPLKRLVLCDLYAREVATISRNKPVTTGKYVEYLDITSSHLPPGIYYFTLPNGEQTLRKKMIIR